MLITTEYTKELEKMPRTSVIKHLLCLTKSLSASDSKETEDALLLMIKYACDMLSDKERA